MTTEIDIGTLIITTPETCGGRPRIAGTRMTVQSIAMDYRIGMSAEEIAQEYPHLTLAQIYTALAYYHASKGQIEADILAYQEDCVMWEKELSE